MTSRHLTKRNATSMVCFAACAVVLCGCRTAPPMPNIDSSRFQPDVAKAIGTAMAESAKRAIVQCQAYVFLPKQQYDTWKYIPMTFGLKEML